MDSILQYEGKKEDDYYVILGCDELSTTEQICAEYKIRALECHPDKHGGDAAAAEKFARLQVAKMTLTDPEARLQYDQWKRSGVAIRFEEWKARKDSIHTSLHWAMKTKKEPMLEGPPTAQESGCDEQSMWTTGSSEAPWHRDPATDILAQFRSYQI